MKFILKRVADSFTWPLGEPWHGYINHHEGASEACVKCDATGFSDHAKRLLETWYGQGLAVFRPGDRGSAPLKPSDPHVRARAARLIAGNPTFYGSGEAVLEREASRLCGLYNAQWSHHLNEGDVAALLKEDRLWDFTRDSVPGVGFVRKPEFVPPTAAQVNIWSIETAGHDDSNACICVKAECERLGVPYCCDSCEHGTAWKSVEAKAASEAWVATEPPAGDGYQMWNTEAGAPVSPVFASAEEITGWLAGNELKAG